MVWLEFLLYLCVILTIIRFCMINGDDSRDWLNSLRQRMVPLSGVNRGRSSVADFKVMLVKRIFDFSIRLVDKDLKPITVESQGYAGRGAAFVRAFNQLVDIQSRSGDFSWEDEEGDRKLMLKEFPEIMSLLRDVPEIVDEKGVEIKFVNETFPLCLKCYGSSGQESGEVKFNSLIVFKDDEGAEDEEGSGCAVPKGVAEFMTADYAYSEESHVICPVESVGPNFENAFQFMSVFKKGDLEWVLSLFLSYFSNITPVVKLFSDDGGLEYEFEEVKGVERYKPTLAFEEVDSQNALYVRLRATIPGVGMELTDLGLTTLVRMDKEREGVLTVRRFAPIDLGPFAELLEENILKCAPSRKDAKEAVMADDLYILPESMAGNFLFNRLPGLLSDFRIIGADKLKSYKVRAVSPKLNVSLSSGIDFLSGSANVMVEDQVFSLADLISRYSKQRYLQLADGTRAIIDSEYMRRLERIYKHNRGKKGEFKVSFFDLPEVEFLLDAKIEGEGMKAPRKFYNGFAKLKGEGLRVPKLNAKLRPYQKEGVKWIKYLYDNKIGGCLADDMGLGKTIQTISALLTIYEGKGAEKGLGPTLVVMPKSLLFNWGCELERFAPSLRVATYYGQGRSLEEALKAQVVLTTYSVVRNDIEELQKVKFNYVILDESQNIKNIGAQSTRAVWLLDAEHRLAISGTPIENNLTELYSLFRFLNPTMFGSLDEFNERYTYPIQKQDSEECAEELRHKVFPFILRRLKKNVLSDLPDLTEQVLRVEMEPEHRSFYEKRRVEYYEMINSQIATEGLGKSQFVLFQALSELRRIASIPESLTDGRVASPKIPLLAEKLEDAVVNGHKVVVFFNFIAGLDLAAECLKGMGIEFETMTGATQNRQEVVNRFQNSQSCKVLLMTLKTGGVGLNLTAADTVVIFEPWWNKAAEMQAVNRLHRIGQRAKVMSYSIITSDTIEDRILELQQKKSLLVDSIISSDGAAKHLTEEDIRFILK